MTAYDPKDDVDRLFACFKCGVSPPSMYLRCSLPLPPITLSISPSTLQSVSPSTIRSAFSVAPRVGLQGEAAPAGQEVAGLARVGDCRYNDMDSKIRHHYEVIQEASPCHIYFDLEFDTRLNKKRDTDEMVDILIAVVFSALRDKYSIEGHEEWITELDSSTEEKFSRHLIIRIPKIAFKDNSHVGAFVCEVCSQIAAQRTTNHDLDKLYITKEISSGPVDRLFMDTAVYSRNRCFRLVFSSKSGKKSFLVPTKRFKCQELNDKDVFMESLICRLDDNCEKLLICKLDLECKKTLHFDSEISMSQESLIIYNMLRSRYCENIGREHKGNHVFYIVDFQRAAYYQKCHDPDCRGYRSPLRPVPWDVIPELVESDQIEYQGHAMETNIENSSMSGKSITGAGAEDPEWWEQVVEFADSIENMDHSLATLEVKSDASIENMDHAPSLCASEENGCFEADPEWVMHAERAMEQYEEQSGGSQSHATSQVFDLEDV
ncbi:DNA primases [Zea mays]|uniref:DNA-directed primase/polymerase protein n=1 Tax=Zea mays TaxID=4577 RepID=A0A1D6IAG5_MAIZE|nr:DNA primases [Zea mays]